MKFTLVVLASAVGLAIGAPALPSCFSSGNNNASSNANRILICNPDEILSGESVDKLKLYELALPAVDDICRVKILISVVNSSQESKLPNFSEFYCPSSNCCDTVFLIYSLETGKISAEASLSGERIQQCRIEAITEKSNSAVKTTNISDLEVFTRLAAFLNALATEYENPASACVEYEIQTDQLRPSEAAHSPVPLITIILGALIFLLVIVLIVVAILVYLSRQGRAVGKPALLFRNGKGEGQETEVLDAEALPTKAKEAPSHEPTADESNANLNSAPAENKGSE